MDPLDDAPGPTQRQSPRAPLRLRPVTRERLERVGAEFLVEILGRETRRNPDNRLALSELAHACTALGRLEEGLEADRALLRLDPDNPIVHYNLACSLALLGRIEQALDALEAAVERGYDDAEFLAQDEDLVLLHAHPRYLALLRLLEAEPSGS